MAWSVSVRDVRSFEKKLRAGEEFQEIPEECIHNSKVIKCLIKNYGARIVQETGSLLETELKQISDSVAYLMRTDMIKSGNLRFIGPNPLIYEHIPTVFGEDGQLIHLLNDPNDLHLGFEIPKEFKSDKMHARGAEFFRCYGATFDFLPKIKTKLDPNSNGIYSLAFPFADMTAYLLDPRDLTDYKYTKEEIERYHGKLAKELQEI